MNIKNMHIVDQLGHINAQIAELEEQKAALRQQIIDRGEKEIEGEMFRATVSMSDREGRDQIFKNKIEELICDHLSRQFISAHTTSTPVTVVKVTARKGVALKVLGDK
jgi:hypothetical protein